MPEPNPLRTLTEFIHELVQQKKAGFRAGAGGDPSGETLWLYFSRGEAIESRIVFRAGLRDGKPVVLVDRLEGDAFQILGKLNELQRQK